jgi:ubiquinone/menaquinone biosynthesis C-methylase UbiE
MEGFLATWYAKNTRGELKAFEAEADRIAQHAAIGGEVLEIAPGPGFLAVALAERGFRVAAVDISHSFVEMVALNAAAARVAVEVRHGDAADLPFGDARFDFIICRAAFKNFSAPLDALREIRRVLKPQGAALIVDMRGDASDSAIAEEVRGMRLGGLDAVITRAVFKYSLRPRAYDKADFLRMAGAAGWSDVRIDETPLGLDVWLRA